MLAKVDWGLVGLAVVSLIPLAMGVYYWAFPHRLHAGDDKHN